MFATLAADAVSKVTTVTNDANWFLENAWLIPLLPAVSFVLILFFKDKETLEDLKLGKIQFTGQAGVDAVTVGAAGTPTYNEGVAIIPLTNLGLMAEFSAAGTKYNYKPYEKEQ